MKARALGMYKTENGFERQNDQDLHLVAEAIWRRKGHQEGRSVYPELLVLFVS